MSAQGVDVPSARIDHVLATREGDVFVRAGPQAVPADRVDADCVRHAPESAVDVEGDPSAASTHLPAVHSTSHRGAAQPVSLLDQQHGRAEASRGQRGANTATSGANYYEVVAIWHSLCVSLLKPADGSSQS